MANVGVDAEPEAITIDPARTALVDHRHAARLPGAGRLRRDARQRRLAAAPDDRAEPAAAGRVARERACWSSTRARGIGPTWRDAPPAKIERGAPSACASATPGPMGRILIRGEAGHDIIPELYPLPGEPVIDKPGKGAFFATDLHAILQNRGIEQPDRRAA